MLTISKPLSAGQAQAYHKEEFGNARENYYTEGERVRGEWHGKTCRALGPAAVRCAKNTSSGSAKASIRSRASNWCATRRRANT